MGGVAAGGDEVKEEEAGGGAHVTCHLSLPSLSHMLSLSSQRREVHCTAKGKGEPAIASQVGLELAYISVLSYTE